MSFCLVLWHLKEKMQQMGKNFAAYAAVKKKKFNSTREKIYINFDLT